MNEEDFNVFLNGKKLSEATIKHYCDYISSMAEAYGVTMDELVETPIKAIEYIGKLVKPPMRLTIGSARSYRRALCLLYEYKYHKELSRNLFPEWNVIDLDDIKRQYQKDHPEPLEGLWYQEIVVDKPLEWLSRITEINHTDVSGIRSWAFRGQGDAEWRLETSLGRIAHYDKDDDSVKRKLRLFERETMWEFRRESAKLPEYRGFEGVDLLSLVQHYGGKTRLLDFSLAPLLALYMAVEQNETDFAKVQQYKGLDEAAKKKLKHRDFAVWAIDLSRLVGTSGCSGSSQNQTVEDEYNSANKMLECKGDEDKKGIYAIFPATCNVRISAQEGLFLMPKSLYCSFEENLQAELTNNGREEKKFHRKYLSEFEFVDVGQPSPIVIKFVFPWLTMKFVRNLLAEANVTAKNVYPDLTGLGRYVSDIVEQHCQNETGKDGMID